MAGNMMDALAKTGFDLTQAKQEYKERQKNEQKRIDDQNRNRGNNGGGHGNQGGNRNRGGNSNGTGYVGAPYNFVSQWEQVVARDRDDCVGHNVLSDEYLSGEISYRFTAETDIAVGDNGEDFYKDPYGRYAIPGSSIRGMIRNNAQILSLSSIADDVDDYFLMFREVGGRAGNPNRKPYDDILGTGQVLFDGHTVSVLKNVQAGYLVKEGKKYRIYQTCVDKINDTLGKINYYILNERIISNDKSQEKYPFYWKNPQYTQHDLKKGFHKEVKNGRVHYIGSKNFDYNPYYTNVSYRIKGERNVNYVGNPGQDGCSSGVALGTGKMNEKKCQYIIPAIDRSKPSITLNDDDIRAFKIDYQHKLNQLKGMFKKGSAFFDLPKDGEEKPVFYIKDKKSGRVYFGFTPRLRLFYKHPVKDGLSQSQREVRIDYAKTLFGFSGKDDSYKTRLSFSDAVLVDGKADGKQKLILGEPSLSSYNDYLSTDDRGDAVTYNKDGFRIRGVKQYWLRDRVIKSEVGKNENVPSSFTTVGTGAVFEGTLRFHNLTAAELGLIIWCLRLNPASRQQIGKAKPFGYGRIKPEITGLSLLDAKSAYSSETFSLAPVNSLSGDEAGEYVSKYKTEINEAIMTLGIGGKIDEVDSIKEFFAMRDSEHLADPDFIRYMSIDNREYQKRSGPLPYVAEVKRS